MIVIKIGNCYSPVSAVCPADSAVVVAVLLSAVLVAAVADLSVLLLL